jgi:predicted nuclease of predicted toxin-antitoxin system
MYSPRIAQTLRARGFDAFSVGERADLRAAADEVIFETAQSERRVIVTNNVRDFAPLAEAALQTNSPWCGLALTSDRSLPRSKANVAVLVDLLATLLEAHANTDELPTRIEWLALSAGDRSFRG